MIDIHEASALELAAALRSRKLSSFELVQSFVARIEKCNAALNAIVTVDEEAALLNAREADQALARGEVWGPLHGVPMTLKDGHATAGLRTTAGHLPLADHVPTHDGTIAARLRRAGAVILGKTNVSPLLMDIQSDNPIFGRTNNPWDLSRTSGGSSGGAAAALAGRLTPLDIGSDFAGSIRIPAHFCGVFGLKPTEHRVPLAGHIPEPTAAARATSMWSAGPLARTVEDLALALQVISGPDSDNPEIPPASPVESWELKPAQLKIAWAPTFPGVPVARSIRAALERLAAELSRLGATVEEQLPALSWEEQARVRVRLAQAVDGNAQKTSVADYIDALQKRAALVSTWERWFESVDALLCPAAMVTAFPHCPTDSPILVDGEPTKYWRIIGHCAPFNLTGHPVVVVPIGHDEHGLPIGIQVVGRRWSEGRLLAIAGLLARIVGPIGRPQQPS